MAGEVLGFDRHAEWGDGVVIRLEDGDKVTVLVDEVGYKTLSLELLGESHLLEGLDSSGIDP